MTTSSYHGIEAFVGRTPLIRLRRLSKLTGSKILGKAEFMNPGGSVKDRAALGIIMDAESTGRLQEHGPGQTIVIILCDSGVKYQSKLFNAEWLAAHRLDPTRPLESVLDSAAAV